MVFTYNCYNLTWYSHTTVISTACLLLNQSLLMSVLQAPLTIFKCKQLSCVNTLTNLSINDQQHISIVFMCIYMYAITSWSI